MIVVTLLIYNFIITAGAKELNLTPILEEKIINGDLSETNLGYVASIKKAPNHHYCNGVVISTSHVLTAAYCVLPFKSPALFGEILVRIGIRVHQIRNVYYPEFYHVVRDGHYNIIGSYYDIGVIMLRHHTEQEPVDLPPLLRFKLNVGDEAVLVGQEGECHSMMFVKIVEGDAYCPVTKVKTDTVDELLCTFPQLENASITATDIGSPLFRSRKLIGIVSGGYVNSVKPFIAFTSVYNHLKFIFSTLPLL